MTNNEKIGSKQEGKAKEKDNFVTRTITFFNKYQNLVYSVLLVLLVVVFGIIALGKFYLQPRTEKASALISKPVEYFMMGVQTGDTMALMMCLEGDDENEGFLNIASSYKMSKIGNSARYFAGLAYLQLGEKEEALEYLLKFKKKEEVYWYACQGLIADLYDEMGDQSKAIKYYSKAVKSEDPFFTPNELFKLGQMYENDGQWEKALDCYEQIEKRFQEQYLQMGVDRYLEKAKMML